MAGAALVRATIVACRTLEPRLGGQGEVAPLVPTEGSTREELRFLNQQVYMKDTFAMVRSADAAAEELHEAARSLGLGEMGCSRSPSVTFEAFVNRAFGALGNPEYLGAMAGALLGGTYGVQVIPSRFTTYLRAPGWSCLDDLQRYFSKRIGMPEAPPAQPEPRTDPVRVDDDVLLYAGDLLGAAESPADWAVLSLCRTAHRTDHHAIRRNLYLVDQGHESANPHLDLVLEDALATLNAWLYEAPLRPVVVHCHAGQSRTAFVLKAWAMDRYDLSEDEAHRWLKARWPRINRRNERFVEHLEARE